MRTKINEQVAEISGIDTVPFRRYTGKIKLDDLMMVLEKEKSNAELSGYSNLELSINEDAGIIDIYLYGDRDLTEDEKYTAERIAVINRSIDKTSRGETRNELLEK